jgi:hypothetical protein
MGALRQHGFGLFAALLFAAATVALGQYWVSQATPSALRDPEAGQDGAHHANPSAPEEPETGVTPLAAEPCPLEPRPYSTVDLCAVPFGVSWRDEAADATSYRIELGYVYSGERFIYTVPAGVRSFIFRAEEAPGPGTPRPDCQRNYFTLDVVALGPTGEREVGGLVQIAQCVAER